jgi:hypothetical protein
MLVDYEKAAAGNISIQFGIHGSPFRSYFMKVANPFLQRVFRPFGKGERPGHSPLRIYAAALAVALRNASRSLLIVSGSVVGMP